MLVLVFACSLSSQALAVSTRASDQITAYEMNVTPTQNGRLAIFFHIEGTGMMQNIGAESIVIGEKSGHFYPTVAVYDRDDSLMSKSDTNIYGNTIYFNGTSGVEYQVVVTVFAEDSRGYDSRSKTFFVTA